MKKIKLKLMLFLAASLSIAAISSCSKEKEPPAPEPKTVYVCQDPKYTGVNCDQQKTPKRIFITKVELVSFREFKSGTTTWDDCCDYGDYRPEITIHFYEGTPRPGSFQFGLPMVWDANHNQQYVFIQDNQNKFPFEIGVGPDYTIDVMDYDLGGVEEMVAQIVFSSYYSINNFPSVIDRNTSNAHVKIYLDYEF